MAINEDIVAAATLIKLAAEQDSLTDEDIEKLVFRRGKSKSN